MDSTKVTPSAPKRLAVGDDGDAFDQFELSVRSEGSAGKKEVVKVRSRASSIQSCGADMEVDQQADSASVLQMRVDMMYEEQCKYDSEIRHTKQIQEETVRSSNVLLESLEKALCAMNAQRQQIALVDVELMQQIQNTRQETALSNRKLQERTQEVANEVLRTQKIVQEEWNENKRITRTEEIPANTCPGQDTVVRHNAERPVRPRNNTASTPDLTYLANGNDWWGSANAWSNGEWSDQRYWSSQRRRSDPSPVPGNYSTFPCVDAQSRRANPITTISISDPPHFDPTRFEVFRREILWWRDIHYAIEDSALISVMAIRCKDDYLKGLLTSFMEKTRNQIETRNFRELLTMLDLELAKEAGETAVVKMNLWSNFTRKTGETLRHMWQRYDRLILSLQKSDIILPKKIAFHKVLSAMKLMGSQLSILLGTLESRADGEDNLAELKRLSIKLFERHFTETDERILPLEELENKNEGRVGGETDDSGVIVDSFSNEEGEVFEVRKVFRPKRNRPEACLLTPFKVQ